MNAFHAAARGRAPAALTAFLAACGFAGDAQAGGLWSTRPTADGEPVVLTRWWGGDEAEVDSSTRPVRVVDWLSGRWLRRDDATAGRSVAVDPFREQAAFDASAAGTASVTTAPAAQPSFDPPAAARPRTVTAAASPSPTATASRTADRPAASSAAGNPFASAGPAPNLSVGENPFAALERAIQGVRPVGFDPTSSEQAETPVTAEATTAAMSEPERPTADRRLPPARPFGAASPFPGAAVELAPAAPARVEPSPEPPGVASVRETPVLPTRPSRKGTTKATPIGWPAGRAYVTTATRGAASPATVRDWSTQRPVIANEEMIVDLEELPRRAELREASTHGAKPATGPSCTIIPRRPFGPPAWEDDERPLAASANIPVDLTPVRPQEEPVEERIAEFVSSEGPAERQAEPVAEARPAENPFAFASFPQAAEPAEPAVGPMLAPGRAEAAANDADGPEMPTVTAATDHESGPQLLAAAPPETSRLEEYSSGGTARPVTLEAADRTAAEVPASAVVSRRRGAPLVIGAALAVVAIAVVFVRRRLV